jgi:hypothetical protein
MKRIVLSLLACSLMGSMSTMPLHAQDTVIQPDTPQTPVLLDEPDAMPEGEAPPPPPAPRAPEASTEPSAPQEPAAPPAPDEPGLKLRVGDGETLISLRTDGDSEYSITSEESNKRKPVRTEWAMLDLGVNLFVTDNAFGDAPMPFDDLRGGRSLNLDMHLFRQKLNIVKGVLNLEYGLTFSWYNYAFQNDVVLEPGAASFAFAESEEELRKSKLSMTYLTVPLLVNIETNPDNLSKSFRISAGVTGGYRIASRTKTKSEEKRKVKQRDDFNLNDFRYGPMVRIGYGWFNVYGQYALSELFADGEGPVTNPVTIGLSFRPF